MATEEVNIYTALSKVQEKLKAPKNQRNNFGNYNYRSAEDIIEAVKPLLFEIGLIMTISDQIINLGDRYYIEATVTVQNAQGEVIQVTGMAREAEEQKGMSLSQITGTASSYSRKYALNGMFAIDDTKDDDSDEYHKQQTKPAKKASEPKVKQYLIDRIIELADEASLDPKATAVRIGNLQNDSEAEKAIDVLLALNQTVDNTEEEPFND